MKAFYPRGTSSLFLKKHFHGLRPETFYQAGFRLLFVTDEPFLRGVKTGDEGIREVTVGVFDEQPTATHQVTDFGYKLAFDSHLFPGLYRDDDHGWVGRTIGVLAAGPNPADDFQPVPYQFKKLATAKPVLFRTDAEGSAWALVNVGYRAVLGPQRPDAFYVRRIALDLMPLPTLDAPTVTAQAGTRGDGAGRVILSCDLSVTNQTATDLVIPIAPGALCEAVVSDEGGTPVYVTSQPAAFLIENVTVAPGERFQFPAGSGVPTDIFDPRKTYTLTLHVEGTDLAATTTFVPDLRTR